MSSSNTASYSGGIGFFGLLTIAFIVLKICSVINWSWWWVLGPLWIPGTLFLVIALICLVIYGLISGLNWMIKN